MVIVPASGGHVCDAFGRPLELCTDLTLHYVCVVTASQDLAEKISAAVAGR